MRAEYVRRVVEWLASGAFALIAAISFAPSAIAQACANCTPPQPLPPMFVGKAADLFSYTPWLPSIDEVMQKMRADLQEHCRESVVAKEGAPFGPPSEWSMTSFADAWQQPFFARYSESRGVEISCGSGFSPRLILRMERAGCAAAARMELTAAGEPVCVGPEPLAVRIEGPTQTHAMPAGPALTLRAIVTQGAVPLPGINVTVQLGGAAALPGMTDANGTYTFTYEPPTLQPDTVSITASCAECINTARHDVAVHLPEGGEICVGNPIELPAARKIQHEIDHRDHGTHPLHWTRRYVSSGALQGTGLGAGWGHAYAARLDVADGNIALSLGDGTRVRFTASMAGQWVPDNGRDGLAPTTSGGWSYLRALDDTRFVFDAQQHLVAIVQRNGWTHSLAYDTAGQLATVTNAFGRRIDLQRDGFGRITAVFLPDGQTLRYDHSGGQLIGVTFSDGSMRRYHYEDARDGGRLTGWTDENGRRRANYAYDDQGRAISSDDGAGRWQLALPPASSGRILAGPSQPFADTTLTASVIDPRGTRADLAWDGSNGATRLGSATDARFGAATSQYAHRDLPSEQIDFTGARTEWYWDYARQLPQAIIEAAGSAQARTTSFQWHSQWRLPVRIERGRRISELVYDDRGNLTNLTVTDARTAEKRQWAWRYDPRGLATAMTDSRGATWLYGYDIAGNLASVMDPRGARTAIERDSAGRITRIDLPAGVSTDYAYDPRGRLVKQQQGRERTTYTYTQTGKLASVIFPDGMQVRYSYDGVDRLVGAQDNRGASVRYELDAMGNRIREDIVDANGSIALRTRQVFDAFNRLVAVEGATGLQMRYGYDGNGRVVDHADALNQWTRRTLDRLGRTVTTTLVDGERIGQTWDALDGLAQVLDPKGVETRYERNAFNEVVGESSPDIGSWQYTRDAAGDVVRIEDAKAQVTTITRDAMGEPITVERSDGMVHRYNYDAAGRLLRVQDKASQTDYEYDALHGISVKTQTMRDSSWAPTRLQLRYGYEAGGGLASITYPSGMRVLYRHLAGRIVGIDVQRPGKSSPAPFVLDLKHTALGQPQSWRWATGDTATRTFDADGRMTSTEFARYTWDAAGRITVISQDLAAQRPNGTQTRHTLQWQAAYDSRNRLVRFARSGFETRYTYDANSNRLTVVETIAGSGELPHGSPSPTQVTTQQALDVPAANNHLLGFTQTLTRTQANRGASESSSTVRFEVDANGSMTSDGLRRYEYDAGNRMSRVHFTDERGHAASVEYRYNALGQRVFKAEPQVAVEQERQHAPKGLLAQFKALLGWLFTGGRTQADLGTAYIYGDGQIPPWALLGEYDNGSANAKPATEYIWLPTEDGMAMPIGMQREGRLYAVHTDHLGTPRELTDEKRTAVWQWPYSSFGSEDPIGILHETGNRKLSPAVPTEFRLRFPGQYADVESPTAYNHFRTFDAQHGRYREADPARFSGGLNLFAYVAGNPLNHTDPDGLNPVAGAWTGAGVGSAFGPVGTAVGGVIGAGVGAWMGWNVVGPMFRDKTPNKGEPGSWHTNPGDGTSGNGQERLYGPNGQPEVDIDWHPDHGVGKPHGHNWDGGKRGPGVPLSPWPRGRIINGCPAP